LDRAQAKTSIGKTREEIIERSRTKSNAEVKEFVLTFVREPAFALFIDHDMNVEYVRNVHVLI